MAHLLVSNSVNLDSEFSAVGSSSPEALSVIV